MKIRVLAIMTFLSGLMLISACHRDDDAHAAIGTVPYVQKNSSNASSAGTGTRHSFAGAKAGLVNPATGEKYNTVYFDFDRYSVSEQYIVLLKENADYLKTHPQVKLRLEGNTDARGSREYNIGLGQRRSNGVQEVLLTLGVPSQQLILVSFGKEKLAAWGESDKDHYLNRRVEMIYEFS